MAVTNEGGNEEILFECASCQYSSADEADFTKHVKTDHRSELSLWCKRCGKCLNNAGVLVTHIKEQNCEKEEMIYRCGVKDCSFETPTGQTFIHHLRNCHKGSPFIYCVHCEKMFTLPHCLILHMQNDCPLKDRNRAGGEAQEETEDDATATSSAPKKAPASTPAKASATKSASKTTKAATPAKPNKTPVKPSPKARGKASTKGQRASRGSKNRHSDSSAEEDADDPSFRSDAAKNPSLRRSSRQTAPKVTETVSSDFDEDDDDVPVPPKKTKRAR